MISAKQLNRKALQFVGHLRAIDELATNRRGLTFHTLFSCFLIEINYQPQSQSERSIFILKKC